jgi:hypothetical protein
MNNLQKYLDLLGVTAVHIAEATGLSYHSVQKNIKGVRVNFSVRAAIAHYMGLPYQHVWGDSSSRMLGELIRQEIVSQAESERERWLAQYLGEAD